MKALSKVLSFTSSMTNKAIEWLVVLLLLVLSTLMVVAVFYRYVLNDSIYWSAEVSRILLVFISFLGSTVAYKHKAHIGIDVFTEKLSKKNKKFLRFIIGLSFFLFWTLVFFESFKLMPLFMIQTTATLEIPYAYFFSVIPISAFIWILHTLSEMLNTLVGEE